MCANKLNTRTRKSVNLHPSSIFCLHKDNDVTENRWWKVEEKMEKKYEKTSSRKCGNWLVIPFANTVRQPRECKQRQVNWQSLAVEATWRRGKVTQHGQLPARHSSSSQNETPLHWLGHRGAFSIGSSFHDISHPWRVRVKEEEAKPDGRAYVASF